MLSVHKCQYCDRDDFPDRTALLTHESQSRKFKGCRKKGTPKKDKRVEGCKCLKCGEEFSTRGEALEHYRNEHAPPMVVKKKDEQYGTDNSPITLEEIENHWT